jgi:hypothetical protein
MKLGKRIKIPRFVGTFVSRSVVYMKVFIN